MTNLSNEYDKLLDYLENQKKLSQGFSSKRKTPEEIKRDIISKGTKKLLEESQIHSFVPLHPKSFKSKGFSIGKFEEMMRSKLIDDFKKLQSYERPYISVDVSDKTTMLVQDMQ